MGSSVSNCYSTSFRDYCINHIDFVKYMKLPERTKTELCKKLAEEPIPMDGIVEVYPSGINTRYGILECSEKWLYAGEIITPKCMKGQGVLFLNDRNVKYEGYVNNGLPDGVGKLIVDWIKEGSLSFNGTWVYGRPVKGVLEKGSEQMTIEFQENDKMRIGFGRRTHYTGTIAAGVTDIAGITGTGKILFEDGDVYIGGIVDGLMHDKKGEYQQSSRKGGVRFIGSYKNGLREGRGTCYFSNGSKLETEWTAGKPVNSGTFCYEGHKNYTITWKPYGHFDLTVSENRLPFSRAVHG